MDKDEQIKEIIHVFDCEDMPLDKEDIQALRDIADGKKTADERREEIYARLKAEVR